MSAAEESMKQVFDTLAETRERLMYLANAIAHARRKITGLPVIFSEDLMLSPRKGYSNNVAKGSFAIRARWFTQDEGFKQRQFESIVQLIWKHPGWTIQGEVGTCLLESGGRLSNTLREAKFEQHSDNLNAVPEALRQVTYQLTQMHEIFMEAAGSSRAREIYEPFEYYQRAIRTYEEFNEFAEKRQIEKRQRKVAARDI